MGMKTLEIDWDIVVEAEHKVSIQRIAGFLDDRLAMRLDGRIMMSRIVGGTRGMVGIHCLAIDGHPAEIHWKYSWKGDPESIVLLADGEILGQYGNLKATRSSKHMWIATRYYLPKYSKKALDRSIKYWIEHKGYQLRGAYEVLGHDHARMWPIVRRNLVVLYQKPILAVYRSNHLPKTLSHIHTEIMVPFVRHSGGKLLDELPQKHKETAVGFHFLDYASEDFAFVD